MKKVLFFSALLLLLFFLSACFKPAYMVLNLSTDKNPVQAGETFTLTWELKTPGEVETASYKIHINDDVIETDQTTYSGTLTAGNYTVKVEATVTQKGFGIGEKTSTVESDEITIGVYNPGVIFLTTEHAFNTDSFVLAWEPVDGLDHTYELSVNGGETFETSNASAVIEGLSEGEKQFVEVKPKESDSLPSKFFFEIDKTGPTVTFTYGTDREIAALQKSGVLPFGRYMVLSWGYSESVSSLQICFRQNNAPGRPYFIFNPDGTIDTTPNRNESWVDWNPYENSIFVSNEAILINDVEYDPFETGEEYVMYIQATDALGNVGGLNYESFEFSERYDETNTPFIGAFPIAYVAPTEEASGLLLMGIAAANVKEYCKDFVHDYFQPDTSYNSDLMYLELHFEDYFEYLHNGLVDLIDVEFPNFMEDKKDFSSYKINEGDQVEMYRGFVDGEDEAEEAGIIYSVLYFAIDASLDGEYFAYGLPFEYFTRDEQNGTIDGIVIDNFAYVVPLKAAEGM